jgi:tripartite-type tricarboxylate transporter receptor subunit TctC
MTYAKFRANRPLSCAALVLSLVLASGLALANEPFPAPGKVITLVVPFGAGGPTDVVARALARYMERALGTSVIVENKGGAMGTIAMGAVAKARPDGYSIVVVPGNGLTSNLVLIKDLPYKPEDFRMLTPLYRGALALSVPASSPAKSLKEYTDQAKRANVPLIFGGAGRGGASHLTMEQWANAAGVSLRMVYYKGDAQVATDLIGNNVPAMISALGGVVSHYRAGKIRVLAVSTATRLEKFPELPTFAESGYPQIVTYHWAGTAVPSGTPEIIADKLRSTIVQAMATPEVQAALSPDMVVYTTAREGEFRLFVQSDYEKLRDIIIANKVVLE